MNIELNKTKELELTELKTINGGSFGFDVGWFIRASINSLKGSAGYQESIAQYSGYYATH
tara:strand:+ start:1362 stop:1541 length:180 start_codon:yes stop_codon:yes gene_type:complete